MLTNGVVEPKVKSRMTKNTSKKALEWLTFKIKTRVYSPSSFC